MQVIDYRILKFIFVKVTDSIFYVYKFSREDNYQVVTK